MTKVSVRIPLQLFFFSFPFSFLPLYSCKLIRLFLTPLLLFFYACDLSWLFLCVSFSFSLKFFELFYFNEFHQKKSFYVFALFPFYILFFNCSVFNYNSNKNDALSNSAKRERLVCWIQRSLSCSLSSSVLLCFARALPRALSLLTQLCWLSENIKNARETFCSKLLTTFIISMCVCSNCLSTNCSCSTLIKQCTHAQFFFLPHRHTSSIFLVPQNTLCRQTEFNCCSSDKTTN